MEVMQIPKDFLNRSVNQGFSGGEKKRNEVLQMLLLEPRLAVPGEADAGVDVAPQPRLVVLYDADADLDVDSLKVVAAGVNSLRSPKRSMLLVTHYERLLE